MSYKTKEECKLELKLQELTGYKEKDPAFLFYSADFIGKMAKFTMEERGQIITLLALQHQNGHLTQKIIDNMVPNLSEDVRNEFKVDNEGNLYSSKLDYVIAKRSKRVISSQKNGLKGGRPKGNKTQIKPMGCPNSELKLNPHENESESEIINEDKIEAASRDNKYTYKKIKFFEDKNISINSKERILQYKFNHYMIPDCFSMDSLLNGEIGTIERLFIDIGIPDYEFNELINKTKSDNM